MGSLTAVHAWQGPCRRPGMTDIHESPDAPTHTTLATAGVPIKAWTVGVPFEEAAAAQLRRVADLPFIHKWVAVMPDVHSGIGATVGSVLAMNGSNCGVPCHRTFSSEAKTLSIARIGLFCLIRSSRAPKAPLSALSPTDTRKATHRYGSRDGTG